MIIIIVHFFQLTQKSERDILLGEFLRYHTYTFLMSYDALMLHFFVKRKINLCYGH